MLPSGRSLVKETRMTRFARARGSKSSNERVPEDATSWHEMKQQLQESRKKSHETQGEPNMTFLKEDNNTEVEKEWAVFEEDATPKKKKKRKKSRNQNTDEVKGSTSEKMKLEQTNKNKPKGKDVAETKGKKLKDTDLSLESSDHQIVNEGSKRKKKKFIQKQVDADNTLKEDNSDKQKNERKLQYNLMKGSKKFDQHFKKPYKRRKPEEMGTTMMYIHGKAIEVVKYEGFPIMKEDADRLKELKKKMIENKIPQDTIKIKIKLERRRAEKALARERRKVCFHCRKPGHNLSECPKLGNDQNTGGTGICFKCGSTEHTHFQCRVNRDDEFRFAKCFVCNEQGHIARQCPDNPRGLYPKGGGCRVCGDVTHLKKDCPDLIKDKEEKTITLETLKNNSLEVLDEDLKVKQQKPSNKKKKHIVKF